MASKVRTEAGLVKLDTLELENLKQHCLKVITRYDGDDFYASKRLVHEHKLILALITLWLDTGGNGMQNEMS